MMICIFSKLGWLFYNEIEKLDNNLFFNGTQISQLKIMLKNNHIFFDAGQNLDSFNENYCSNIIIIKIL